MKASEVTTAMIARMSPEDAAQWLEWTLPGKSPGEPTIPKLERDEQAIFENWLLSHGYAYRHSRTDKPTRERCGAPDFTVYQHRAQALPKPNTTRCLAIEFKLPGNALSKAQQEWAAHYGGVVHVLATAAQAIELVRGEFGD